MWKTPVEFQVVLTWRSKKNLDQNILVIAFHAYVWAATVNMSFCSGNVLNNFENLCNQRPPACTKFVLRRGSAPAPDPARGGHDAYHTRRPRRLRRRELGAFGTSFAPTFSFLRDRMKLTVMIVFLYKRF